MDKIRIKAFAKVNLYLDIKGILPNGYHEIESIMQSISLYDFVTIEKRNEEGISLSCNSLSVPCDERNIAHKAAVLFFNEMNIDDSIHISIEKNIPVQAGLGGGSADCAAVLKGLNIMYGNKLTDVRLSEIGAMLGADVPFCLVGGTKLCNGIGEDITDVPKFSKHYFVVIQPDFFCNTSKAYRFYDDNFVPIFGKINNIISALSAKNTEIIKNNMYNVFETLYKDCRISEVKANLAKNGAICSMMTGSGSAVFGLFKTQNQAYKCARNISYPFVQIAENCNESMEILLK